MLQDQNVERVIKNYTEPLRKQIIMMQIELEELKQQCNIGAVSGSLCFSDREVDFAYLCGVFNASGIDGLHKEIQRLKELGKEPHDIIEACRNQ